MQEANVHHILRTLKGMAALAVLGLFACTELSTPAHAQQAAAPQKKVKDQGEYDLYNNVLKENDPAKKLQYLNQWVEKYPETDFKEEQLQAYSALAANTAQPVSCSATPMPPACMVLDLGQKILAKDPKSLAALTLIPANIQKIQNPTSDQLSAAQKASQTLLDNMDSLKPATVTDDAWKQAKPSIEAMAKGTIDWIVSKPARDAADKKDFPAAEAAYTKLVQQYPDNWQYSYQLGTVLLNEKNVEKYPLAIYEIARSLEVGGMPAANRSQVEPYLTRIFNSYHGADDTELKQLRAVAKNSPLPPPDFKLKTSSEVSAEKENEFREKNPQLALWLSIKKQLADSNGEQYFEGNLKNAAVPKLKGTLVEGMPACRSKELLVAIPLPDAKPPLQAEVTLKLDMPLKGKPEAGSEFQWEGVPSAFTKDPFMLTMDTDSTKVEGLKTETCAAAPAKGPVKKGVVKKKK